MVTETELANTMEKYAGSKGFRLNPDQQFANAVIKGLIENEHNHGYRYCPCRARAGIKVLDAPKICPCRWHKQEIETSGQCHCGLFVRM
jgi:ferredoxin-thioredoxin reductase catalytic subunit